ncbi:MAG TPA: glycosyltransferase [Anaerolineales bacterium]|nr:glycosyltransferase [Anaerolineales bacterium]
MEASVIIPTYNRAEKLRRCLTALSNQTQPASEFEAIVVADGCTDDTVNMLTTLKTPFALRVIQQPNSGQPVALNRGAAESRGRIMIFLDDDIVVTPRFVEEHLCLHRRRDQVVGIGQLALTLSPGADWFARGFAQSWRNHYDAFNSGKRQPDWDDCYGGNMSVCRAIFLEVGGNVTDLRRGYDVELAYRLKQLGCSVEYLPEALGNQYESKGFRELSADSELAGEASVELARRHPALRTRLLGPVHEHRRSWMLLWQIFSTVNLSKEMLNRLQWFINRRVDSFKWFAFFYHYYFWKGMQHALSQRRD